MTSGEGFFFVAAPYVYAVNSAFSCAFLRKTPGGSLSTDRPALETSVVVVARRSTLRAPTLRTDITVRILGADLMATRAHAWNARGFSITRG